MSFLLGIFSLLIAAPLLAESESQETNQSQGVGTAQTENDKMKEVVEYEHMKARERREQQMKKASDKKE